MIFSQSCEYALRALTYLAMLPEGRNATVKEISDDEGLPQPFLAKLLQTMARTGLVTSVKGPGGGFALAVDAQHIALFDVVDCIDGTVDLERCAVGMMECTDEAPCPLHDQWKVLRESIKLYLMRTTLHQMRTAVQQKTAALEADQGATPPSSTAHGL